MKPKIKLLIISLYFPPVKSIGSFRIESFVKYLDKNKIEIDVITVQPKGTNKIEKKFNANIYRVSKSPFDYLLSITNSTPYIIRKLKALWNILSKNFLLKLWEKKAVRKAFKLNENKKYDIILSSYAPEISHIVALKLKKKFPKLKWIADMRDEMSLNPFLSPKQSQILKKLEEKIFSHCDVITTVSKPILDDFKNLANKIFPENKIIFREIRNGFDFEINYDISWNKVFTIGYLGSFYGKRNPDTFFKALEIIIKENKIDNIIVKFAGNIGAINISDFLEKFIKIYPYLEHNKAIEFMKNCDALLLIHPNSGRKGVYTGKLFEYIALNKPIIAVVDKNDVAAQLIKKIKCGFIAEFDNIYEIKKAIISAYKVWEKRIPLKRNLNLIKLHHRKEQTKKLQKIIESLVVNEKITHNRK